jgi:hypothetical protein
VTTPLECRAAAVKPPTMATILAAILAAGCAMDAGDRPVAQRADSAGVEVVTNSGSAALEWSFEPDLVLGGEDAGPASFYRVWPGAVAVDGASNIHVLDAGNHRVEIFTSDGDHVRTLGRQGGGPGEFTFPTALAVTADGVVGVYDMTRQGLVRFGPDGALLEMQPLDPVAGVARVAAVGDGLLVAERRLDPTNGRDLARLLYRSGPDTVVITTIDRVMGPPARFPDCPISISTMQPIFAPELAWSANAGRSVTAAGPYYDVQVRDGTRHVRSIRRDMDPAPATAALAAATVPNGEMTLRFATGECRIPAAAVVEARGFAPLVPAISSVALAPDGELWVERRTLTEDEHAIIDIFDPDGLYLGELPPGSPFPVAFMPDGRIIANDEDEFDVQRLVVYHVSR